MNKEQEICPDCDGKGECIVSCCTGEIIKGDYDLCPECFEHCGLDTCELCNGTCKVDIGTMPSDFVDPQLKAEYVEER